jgi:hypothetical protein
MGQNFVVLGADVSCDGAVSGGVAVTAAVSDLTDS